MIDKRDRQRLIDGITVELANLFAAQLTAVQNMRRQLLAEGALRGMDTEKQLDTQERRLKQLQWLVESLLELLQWDGEAETRLADIGERMEIIASAAEQEERSIPAVVEQRELLVAKVNIGFLYSACANIWAYLYYYSGAAVPLRIAVGQQRAVELSMEGVLLPPMIRDIVNSRNPVEQAADRFGTRIYGLILARLYCESMGWTLSLREENGATVFSLGAPSLQLTAEPALVRSFGLAEQRYLEALTDSKLRRAFGLMWD